MKKLVLFFVIFIILFKGIDAKAFWPWSEKYIAKVNGEIITLKDFKKKLAGFHSVKDIGKKMNIDIPNVQHREILNNLIDERLMIQEALKIELNKTREFIMNYNLNKLNYSLDMLRMEEVIDKIKISEREIHDQFVTLNESVRIRQLFTKDRAKGEAYLNTLKDGADFFELARKESKYPESIKKEKKDLPLKKRGQMNKEIADVAFSLGEGEISDLIEMDKSFVIIKLEEKQIPSREISEKERKFIKKIIFKKKEKKINDEYIASLKNNAEITINETVIHSLNSEDKVDGGKMIAVTVNGIPITRDEILIMLKTVPQIKNQEDNNKIKRDKLNILIRDKLFELEVADRNYEQNKNFQKQLSQTMDVFLLRLFKKKIIGGALKLSEEEMLKYYKDHENEFMEPDEIWLRIIELYNEEEANKVLEELKEGADFGVMAMEMSKNRSAQKKGNLGWIKKNQLDLNIKSKIDDIEVGEIDGPFRTKYGFVILKLEGRKKGSLKEFTAIKSNIFNMMYRKKYFQLLDEYIKKLRLVSKIVINESALNSFIKSKK